MQVDACRRRCRGLATTPQPGERSRAGLPGTQAKKLPDHRLRLMIVAAVASKHMSNRSPSRVLAEERSTHPVLSGDHTPCPRGSLSTIAGAPKSQAGDPLASECPCRCKAPPPDRKHYPHPGSAKNAVPIPPPDELHRVHRGKRRQFCGWVEDPYTPSNRIAMNHRSSLAATKIPTTPVPRAQNCSTANSER